MPTSLPSARLPIAGVLAIAALTLGWLLLVFAGERHGRVALPTGDSRVEFFVDAGKQRSWEEIGRLSAKSWQHWDGRAYLSADPGTALWVRVALQNPTDRPMAGALVAGYSFLDHVDAWTDDGGRLRNGESVPAAERALPGRDAAFPVLVPARGTRQIWLRAEDYFRPFLFPAWWPDQAAFHAHQSRALLAEGIYFGGLLALLGYNTILWLRLRVADLGCYVLYLGFAAIVMFLIRAYPAVLGWTLSSPVQETALTLALAACGIFLTQFAREFLELKTRVPGADRLARGLRAAMIVLAASAFATPWLARPYALLATVVGLGVTHLGLLTAAVWAWRDGVRQARFFILSFVCLFGGSFFLAANWLGGTSSQDAAALSLMLGSALEMLLLALAVADRFVAAQRARVAAQARRVEETEQRRAVEEAYADELAVEVRERTRELVAVNHDKDRMLAVIGHDLRNPLTALTQSAELLAGSPADGPALEKFAGDTAVMGREVLLLIEDLVLWARLRAGLIQPPGAHHARALVAPVVALHRAFAGHRGIELVVKIPAELRVATDLVLMQTLLRNLVANALKFARGRVTVEARALGDEIRFTVADDGPGLPPAVAAGIATDISGTVGSGLGLRLCAEISQALGARLATAPAAGGGTEFTFMVAAAPGETIT